MTATAEAKSLRTSRKNICYWAKATWTVAILRHVGFVEADFFSSSPNGGSGSFFGGASSFIELNPDYIPHPSRIRGRASSTSSRNRNILCNHLGGDGGDGDEGDENDGAAELQQSYYSYVRMPNILDTTETTRKSRYPLLYSSGGGSHRSPSSGFLSLLRESSALFPSLAGTTASCIGVFVCWQIPSMKRLLQEWFVASRQNLVQGRWPSLIFSAFSHSSFMHLVVNLLTLVSFGPAVQRSIQFTSLQPWPIWPLLLGATLSGSLTFLAWQAVLMTTSSSSPMYRYHHYQQGCMGLSAVTCALVAVFCRMNPDAQLRLLVAGILPVQLTAPIFLGVLFFIPIVAMFMAPYQQGGTAHAAHLGGLVFGILYHELWMRRYRIAWRVQQTKQKFFAPY